MFLDLKMPAPEEMLKPSYNIAPTQRVPVARLAPDGSVELVSMRWGLVPSWSNEPGSGFINARSETAATNRVFRKAYEQRPCIVPASGFYEWQKPADDGPKQPWYITMKDDSVMGFAGVWERWDHEGAPIDTFAILTTSPNDLMRPIHDRMPVILTRGHVRDWLNTRADHAAARRSLLTQVPAALLRAHPVSRRVNSPKVNDERCIEPEAAGGAASARAPGQPGGLF